MGVFDKCYILCSTEGNPHIISERGKSLQCAGMMVGIARSLQPSPGMHAHHLRGVTYMVHDFQRGLWLQLFSDFLPVGGLHGSSVNRRLQRARDTHAPFFSL